MSELTREELDYLLKLYEVVPHEYGITVMKLIAYAGQADRALERIADPSFTIWSAPEQLQRMRDIARAARLKETK